MLGEEPAEASMLHIAGGTYLEYCKEPYWRQLYGSGGRAAAAVSELANGVVLWTYISEQQRPTLDALATNFGFTVQTSEVADTVSFSYQHGLAVPEIHPEPQHLHSVATLHVHADMILRFGFLEGDAEVHGKRVVYDPQSISHPAPFASNGSTAEQLVIVANMREAIGLAATTIQAHIAGQNNTGGAETIGWSVLTEHNADAIIIKQGSIGATLVTLTDTHFIPPIKTSKVWPIGSGDVFAAAFAHAWAEQEHELHEAAEWAARATAYYCESRVLPLPKDPNQLPTRSVSYPGGSIPATTPLVYLAGPFFTMAQRWLINQARSALYAQGLSVFSPFHDVGHGRAEDVVPADIAALDRSEAILAILDGLDSGTLFEVGYARAKGIPVIAFVQNESLENLKMLEGTQCDVSDDFVTAVYRAAWIARER